jgi:hypothetical protein
MPPREGEPLIAFIPPSFFGDFLQERGRGKNRLQLFVREAFTDERILEGDVGNQRNHDPL